MAIQTLITPFQFSSRKIMAETFLGHNLKVQGKATNLAIETVNSLLSWYEMWVNPEKLDLTTQYINSGTRHTAGGLVTFHYRKNVTVMSVSGVVGWIMNRSDLENAQDSMIQSLTDPNNFGKGIGDSIIGGATSIGENALGFTKGARNSVNNSPRLFLKRLKELADSPMYYIDKDGIEHYNTKYIKIFTKQYPNGLICEGFFNNFVVPEAAVDEQTINYNFEFIIENEKPVSTLQRLAGMFAGTGNIAGDALRMLS